MKAADAVLEGKVTEITEDRALVVRPAVSPEIAKENWDAYQALTRLILDDSDYQTFTERGQKRRFKKKSAWRKYATNFNLSDRIVSEVITRSHDERTCELLQPFAERLGIKECSCGTTYARYVVEVVAPNGRVTTGVGVCSLREHEQKKPDNDIPGTAHTRAKNRAISDMIGAGEVSAEEVMVGGRPAPETTGPAAVGNPMSEAAQTQIKAIYKAILDFKKKTPEDPKVKALLANWVQFMNAKAGGKWERLFADASLTAEAYKILDLGEPPVDEAEKAAEFDPDAAP